MHIIQRRKCVFLSRLQLYVMQHISYCVTRHFGCEDQLGFLWTRGEISVREGYSHELSRWTCVRLARIRRGLGYGVGFRKEYCIN